MLAECSLCETVKSDLVVQSRLESAPYSSCTSKRSLLRLCYRSAHSSPTNLDELSGTLVVRKVTYVAADSDEIGMRFSA